MLRAFSTSQPLGGVKNLLKSLRTKLALYSIKLPRHPYLDPLKGLERADQKGLTNFCAHQMTFKPLSIDTTRHSHNVPTRGAPTDASGYFYSHSKYVCAGAVFTPRARGIPSCL